MWTFWLSDKEDLDFLIMADEDALMLVLLPENFLGGSAPHLRSCSLDNLPFPVLRRLLLSASHLVKLCLDKIPPSGYMSPEAMFTCLSAVPRLESLVLGFYSLRCFSDIHQAGQTPPPPPPPHTHTVFPALTQLHFSGVSEYLEDPISQVAPAAFLHRLDAHSGAHARASPTLADFCRLITMVPGPSARRIA